MPTNFLEIVCFIVVTVWKFQDNQCLLVPGPSIPLEGPGHRHRCLKDPILPGLFVLVSWDAGGLTLHSTHGYQFSVFLGGI